MLHNTNFHTNLYTIVPVDCLWILTIQFPVISICIGHKRTAYTHVVPIAGTRPSNNYIDISFMSTLLVGIITNNSACVCQYSPCPG